MAYRCPLIGGKKCPESSSRDGGCPAWVDSVIESNLRDGTERVTADCVLRLLPRWLLQGYSNTDGVRAEMGAMRDSISDAVERSMGKVLESGLELNTRLVNGGGSDRDV